MICMSIRHGWHYSHKCHVTLRTSLQRKLPTYYDIILPIRACVGTVTRSTTWTSRRYWLGIGYIPNCRLYSEMNHISNRWGSLPLTNIIMQTCSKSCKGNYYCFKADLECTPLCKCDGTSYKYASGTKIRGQLYWYAQCHWKGPAMQPSSWNWIFLPPERNWDITTFSVTTDTVSDICLSWINACLIMWRPSWIPIWRPNDGNFHIL